MRRHKNGISVKVPLDRYLKLKRIARAEGRSILFLMGKAIDLFLIGYTEKEVGK